MSFQRGTSSSASVFGECKVGPLFSADGKLVHESCFCVLLITFLTFAGSESINDTVQRDEALLVTTLAKLLLVDPNPPRPLGGTLGSQPPPESSVAR